jgi:hypothetical protein
MRRAGHVIAVSSAYIATLRARYPFFSRIPASELPFGSPDTDLARLRATLPQRPPLLPPGGFRLAFAGALGPGQFGAVEQLFAALAAARKSGSNVSAHFFGTSYDPAARPVVLERAARHGLQGGVFEKPGRLRYFDALQLTLEADANLLFGSADLAFTPSKILGVLAAGRPVVAIAPAGSAMLDRLQVLGQDGMAFPADVPDPTTVSAISALLQKLAGGHGSSTRAPAEFGAPAVAHRQLEILDSLT